MHRDNWKAVFENQDKILMQLRSLEDQMFLVGGTGLQRFVLPMAYRHSENLDFSFPTIKTKKEIDTIKTSIMALMSKMPEVKLDREPKWIKDEQSWRLFYAFKDNHEIIKIELLNFTCARLKDISFNNHELFYTENLYNLLLYKLKALCDRPDTIKDLFDLYFIFRDLEPTEKSMVMEDLNAKFEEAIGINYSIEDIVNALNHKLEWNIEVGAHLNHLHGLKMEIDLFQRELKSAFLQSDILDFNFKSKIEKKASAYGLTSNDYIEIIEDNAFIVSEWKHYVSKNTNGESSKKSISSTRHYS